MASLQERTGVLGKRLAAHLLRRVTFTPTKARIDAFAQKTAAQAVAELLIPAAPHLSEPIDPASGSPWINSGIPPVSQNFRLRTYVIAWWLDEARRDISMLSRMSFFLHTVFVTAHEGQSTLYFDHISLLRYNALGNFKKFAVRMTYDNLMLAYLDNTLNNKANPNENYARELLELFTIGKGDQVGLGDYTNYTEDDVVQAARVLTGIKRATQRNIVDSETNIPSGYNNFNQHDTGDKTFSHRFNNHVITGATNAADMRREIEDFIDMIYTQAETARYFVRKLYRYFVGRKITSEIEADVIEPLATTFSTNNFEIVPVLQQLFQSQHFYDADDMLASDEIIGNMIKSPLELFLGAASLFDIPVPDPSTDPLNHYQNFYNRSILSVFFPQAGFELFKPSVVAGYPAYYQIPSYHRNWFNSSSIIARYKLSEIILTGRRVLAGGGNGGVELNVTDWVDKNISEPGTARTLVTEFLAYMIPEEADADRFDYYFNDIFLAGQTEADWAYEWGNFTLSGDDTEVKIPISNLITAIMYSPEYQLF
ncbi:MAG: DUF1800 family protein [Bacteroidota bacterium]